MTLAISPYAECRICKAGFIRMNTMQFACSIKCARKVGPLARKAEAEQTRARRVALMTRRDWINAAQDAFNAWVKARDVGLPCISCDETNPPMTAGGQWDAGHWKSRGSHPELKFHPDNCHKQCKKCNGGSGKFAHKARTVSDQYRERLIARIGLERVEALEGPHPPAKYSVDELKTIRDSYRLLTKQLLEKQSCGS